MIKKRGETMGKFQDITGQKFGKLTVIKRAPNKGRRTMWTCQCDCGKIVIVYAEALKNGNTKSCGCLTNRNADITGQRFGRLTVIKRAGSDSNRSVWFCKCDCGKVIKVKLRDLVQGDTKSCGCYASDAIKQRNDERSSKIIGKRFGRLVVVRKAGILTTSTGHKTSVWECVCDCGNKKEVRYEALISGNTNSCGCMNSLGEENTIKALLSLNVKFNTQYTNPNLRSEKGNLLLVDFAVYSDNDELKGLIEYQGIQHYQDEGNFGKQQREITDDIKRQWCKENNIPLLEIRYDDSDIISTLRAFLQQIKLL